MQVSEGQCLWTPSKSFVADSNMMALIGWLETQQLVACENYQELWQWSVTEPEAFWGAMWRYFEVLSDTPYTQVMSHRDMGPGVKWFAGSQVNFAEHILRHEGNHAAISAMSESDALRVISWNELNEQVRRVATSLRTLGIEAGDKISAVLPNRVETVVAMLASISIGAVWSNAAPEFGTQAILDRLGQVGPKLVFFCDGYEFNSGRFDCVEKFSDLLDHLPSVENVVRVDVLGGCQPFPNQYCVNSWTDIVTGDDPGRENFIFTRVGSDHPLWFVFSSGTTGLPKAIAHSHIGVLIEMLKFMSLHMNLKPGDNSFFYTTTGWVMFNLLVGMMLTGAGIILYDGSPVYPETDTLWRLAEESDATHFGASPTYVQLMESNGIVPKNHYALTRLSTVLVGGSPSMPSTFDWFYQNVKHDMWVTSQSGGTEIASAFVAATPTQAVYAAEIQARALGMSIKALDDKGVEVFDQVGELVCDLPFPSMPLYFLNDEDGTRYNSSYFEEISGVWRHGDFIKINQRGGCYIYGRSDATLNRFGVRIGTAEIYRTVESIEGVSDSLIVCIETDGGGFYMPLFISLENDVELNDALRNKIKSALRNECSPRHVPDEIVVAPDIPYTLTGKKLEVPVRKLLKGDQLEKVASPGSMKNPDSLAFYVDFSKTVSANS
ncbi:Acetyl-coenzyme A synthetase [Zhongshania aliphaticivorans]|uniref:Acetyl-coenzyme A synthetase n=1 Tax=Zhongshania aliphaticivorans TaxID=1470434 RepID=A0A5S9N7X1_9GAMM|nr:acetoacetate--CoA ligase [Zhongshania aliphaticivorans]CAA0079784.1 Acetyl-coenzyme A synthetase [Zhongshania aliphaticivorans]CAA0085984.1 Acetyl-coenzyme A synthetase [Zhongshania aliphaticivorans]